MDQSVVRDLRATSEDADLSLRPLTLNDYIGQTQAKQSLKIYIDAAKARNESMDHVLLYGPPGLGKTTMAHVIANELGAQIRTTSGPALVRPGDLASILSGLNAGDILFIDEIHRLPKPVEEVLYSAMEDYILTVVVGRDEQARTIEIPLRPFTLIGATTQAGNLSQPLRDRFGIIVTMKFYELDELVRIVERTAKVFDFPIDGKAALDIAVRSRGTPRIANRTYRRVRDHACVLGKTSIDESVTIQALKSLGIDSLGLDESDRRILTTMIKRFGGRPVGVSAIAAAVGEQPENIVDIYEPYMIRAGLIDRTLRGRVCTRKAYAHLGIPYPDKD